VPAAPANNRREKENGLSDQTVAAGAQPRAFGEAGLQVLCSITGRPLQSPRRRELEWSTWGGSSPSTALSPCRTVGPP
jgi:hypothetical protein